MIHSWHAYLLAVMLVCAGAFTKVILPRFPYETFLIAGLVPVTLGYLGKRMAQKLKVFNGKDI